MNFTLKIMERKERRKKDWTERKKERKEERQEKRKKTVS